jgi:hypothetical protein
MALVLNDRVKETTTTTGTGTVNLAGAETGFETFVAGIGNTNTTYYAIVHQTADEFEVGLGTVSDSSPDTLSRTTIISSSNSDSGVNFSAGTKDVFCTLPASKTVFIDGSGDLEFNAPGNDFLFRNSSNLILGFYTANNDFLLQNNLNDKDVIFKGYDSDGGGLLEALRIDYSEKGNIGIGTSTPTFRLDVNGNLSSDGNENVMRIAGSDTNNAGGITINNVYGSTAASRVSTLFSIDGQDQAAPLAFGNGTSEAMRIDSSGKVGIGTSAPAAVLDVVSSGATSTAFRVLKSGTSTQNLHAATEISGHGRYSIYDSSENEDIRFDSNGDSYFNGGNVGIGESSPDNKLHVNSGSTNVAAKFESTDSIAAIQFTDSGGSAEIGCSGTSNTFYPNGALKMSLDSSGNLVASGNITAYGSPSDIKLKENIEVIDNALDKVKQLKGITYDLKSDGNRLTGLIAQDLEKVLPEAVYTAKDLEDEEHLAIRYGNTVGLLVEAIKEQQEQIETLTAKVKELESK